MAWPTGTIPTTGLENPTDTPEIGRPNIKQSIDHINDIVASRGAVSGIPSLDASQRIPDLQMRQLQEGEFKSANYTAVESDLGAIFNCTGNITITLFDGLPGWNLFVKNGNLGTSDEIVTVLPSPGSVIEGQSSIALKAGQGLMFNRASNQWITLQNLTLQSVSGYVATDTTFRYDYQASRVQLGNADFAKNGWRSIGKSGSGADFAWQALDIIPNAAVFARLSIYGTLTNTVGNNFFRMYARPFGSALAVAPSLLVAHAETSTEQRVAYNGLKVIPVDAQGRFELFWEETGAGAPITVFTVFLDDFSF